MALGAVVAGVWFGAGGQSGAGAPRPATVTPDVPGGDAIAPGTQPRKFIFERVIPRPTVLVRTSSTQLLERVPGNDRLHASALESTDDAAALMLVEDSPGRPWGELATPAQRKVFRAFAKDDALGDWLIVLVDIQVYGLVDPVPLTAYRWSRLEVEAYATCGIPDSGLVRVEDDCTDTFYRAGDVVIIRTSAGRQGPSQ